MLLSEVWSACAVPENVPVSVAGQSRVVAWTCVIARSRRT